MLRRAAFLLAVLPSLPILAASSDCRVDHGRVWLRIRLEVQGVVPWETTRDIYEAGCARYFWGALVREDEGRWLRIPPKEFVALQSSFDWKSFQRDVESRRQALPGFSSGHIVIKWGDDSVSISERSANDSGPIGAFLRRVDRAFVRRLGNKYSLLPPEISLGTSPR